MNEERKKYSTESISFKQIVEIRGVVGKDLSICLYCIQISENCTGIYLNNLIVLVYMVHCIHT